MSTTTTTRPDAALRRRTTVVATAFVLLLLHNLDEAFFHPEPGGRMSVVGTLVLAVLVVIAHARLGRGWRVGLTGVFGALATLQAIGGHVVPLVTGDGAPLDWSGLLYLAGGLALAGVAVAEVPSTAGTQPDA